MQASDGEAVSRMAQHREESSQHLAHVAVAALLENEAAAGPQGRVDGTDGGCAGGFVAEDPM